jgi:hypothetical protein
VRRLRAAWLWFADAAGVHHVCYASGLLLILGGSSGSAASYLAVADLAGPLARTPLGPVVEGLKQLLVLFATLGGTSVLIGGYLAEKRAHTLLCSAFVALGCGLGLLGAAQDVAALAAHPSGLVGYLTGFGRGLAGLGTLLGLAAQVRLLFPYAKPGRDHSLRARWRRFARHLREPAEPPAR